MTTPWAIGTSAICRQIAGITEIRRGTPLALQRFAGESPESPESPKCAEGRRDFGEPFRSMRSGAMNSLRSVDNHCRSKFGGVPGSVAGAGGPGCWGNGRTRPRSAPSLALGFATGAVRCAFAARLGIPVPVARWLACRGLRSRCGLPVLVRTTGSGAGCQGSAGPSSPSACARRTAAARLCTPSFPKMARMW